tara:strand:+ start:74 stop:586 length:513 start_codon:yes stop_codon:yes gene_type:complete
MKYNKQHFICINHYYLYISSHYFLIPLFLCIYTNRYDLGFWILSILVTSILRWGNPTKELYQYIDHNWVKVIFMYFLISTIDMAMKNKMEMTIIVFIFGILLSILIIWLFEYAVYMRYHHKRNWFIIHMLVHFYAIIGCMGLVFIDYDFTTLIRSGIRFTRQYFQNVIRG